MRAEVRREEAALVHALTTTHPKVPPGLIEAYRIHEHHFFSRDRQGKASDEDWVRPKAEHIYMRLDYGENFTLPIGPSEEQSWWFATARLSVTNLHIVCWRLGPDGAREQRAITIMTTVLEKSQLLTLTLVDRVMELLEDWALHARVLRWWSDRGNHCCGYHVLHYWIKGVPQKEAWSHVGTELQNDAEHHGKGVADANVAHMKAALRTVSHARPIYDATEAVEACRERAAKVANPVTQRLFEHFMPPPKPTLRYETFDQRELRRAGITLQSSYSWSGGRIRIGDHEHWRLDQHVWTGDPVVRYLHFTSVPMPAEDEDEVWRTAYRVKVPEKEAPLWGLLATRMEQHGGATASVAKRKRSLESRVAGAFQKRHRALALRRAYAAVEAPGGAA